MLIIDNSYFINDIYIPHAKPSITDSVTGVGTEIVSFIDEYERECLIKTLGYQLFKEFETKLDRNSINGLVNNADVKWDYLLNGREYTKSNGDLAYWQGLRCKTNQAYNKSLLAQYVYFFYEKSDDDSRVGVGNVKEKAANADTVSKTPKVIAAWRKFCKSVQGSCSKPAVYIKHNGVGVDWYDSSGESSMYEFIAESNLVDETTYPNWKPTYFENANQFGI